MTSFKSMWLKRLSWAVWFNIILTFVLLSNLYNASGSGDISGLDFFFALIYGITAILYPVTWLVVPEFGIYQSRWFSHKRVLAITSFSLAGSLCGAILLFSPTMSTLPHFFVVIFFPIYLAITGPHIILVWHYYRRYGEGARAD